jgi:riboflavin biosynthesis pyrimidine reductase
VRQIFPADTAPAEIGHAERGDSGPAAQAAVMGLADLYAYPAAGMGDRPWLRANMVVSADGAASLAGRSAGLSGPADRLVFSVLRSLADVILVGAGTARVERYRPAAERDIWAALRDGRELTPPIAVVTRELSLDPDGPLLGGTPAGSRTIVLTTAAAPAARRAAAARHADVIVAGLDSLTPAAVIGALAERGHRRLLIEGGPSLLAHFTAAGLLDDLCLTVSPLLEGGWAGRILRAPETAPETPPEAAQDGAAGQDGPVAAGGPAAVNGPGTAGGPGVPAGLRLVHVLEDRGSLLCRYLRDTG